MSENKVAETTKQKAQTNGTSSKQPTVGPQTRPSIAPESTVEMKTGARIAAAADEILASLERQRDLESAALRARGGEFGRNGVDDEANLADLISIALGGFTDENIERHTLRSISDELYVLRAAMGALQPSFSERESFESTRQALLQLANRALAVAEIGRRFERAAKAVSQ